MTGFGIFGMVPIQLLTDARMNESALRAYIAVSSYIGDRDYCSADRDALAARAGLSEDQLWRGLDSLIKAGWILRVRRGRGLTNAYRRMMPEIVESAEDLTADLFEAAPDALAEGMTPQPLRTQEELTPQPVRTQEPMTPQPLRSPIKRSENIRRSDTLSRDVPPEAVRLAELILTERRKIDPGFQSNPEKRETALARWAKDLDLLARRDGRPWKDIERVMRWALRDPFWSGNILSGAAVRKQFDRLYVKVSGARVPTPTPEVFDNWKVGKVEAV